jgi:sortase A
VDEGRAVTATGEIDLSEYEDDLTEPEAADPWSVKSEPPKEAKPPTARPTWVAVSLSVAVAVSLLAAWALAYTLGLSALQENRSQTELYASMRESLADPQSEPVGAIAPGTPVVLLQAARAGIHDLVVVEGTASGDLQAGPGHRRDTVLPGQPGVSVLLGRSAAFGGPFGQIAALRPGDLVTATTAQGTFTYRVDRVRHAGDPLPVPLTGSAGRLTLVTSVASGWRSGWAPSGTVYVDATLQGTPVSVPPGRPASVPAAEQPMAGDSGALMPLVLWLQGLVLVALATVWAKNRWGTWQTWLVGGPLLLAALWGASSAAVQLLPNLL